MTSHEAALTYVLTKENIADIIKGLKLHQHHYLMGKSGFGVRDFSLRGSVSNHISNDDKSPTTEPACMLEPWLGPTYFLFGLCFPYMDSLIVCPN